MDRRLARMKPDGGDDEDFYIDTPDSLLCKTCVAYNPVAALDNDVAHNFAAYLLALG